MKILALCAALVAGSQVQALGFASQDGASLSSTNGTQGTTQNAPIYKCTPHCGG